jgi:hypothetical protein
MSFFYREVPLALLEGLLLLDPCLKRHLKVNNIGLVLAYLHCSHTYSRNFCLILPKGKATRREILSKYPLFGLLDFYHSLSYSAHTLSIWCSKTWTWIK